MNFQSTNKVLKKSTKRVVTGHILWGVLLLACLGPMGYLYGFMKTQERFDPAPFQEIMQQSAQLDPQEQVAPPRTIARYLHPFGRTDTEASYFNGRRIWRSAYKTNPRKPASFFIDQASKAWTSQGLVCQQTAEGVTGRHPRSRVMVVGKRSQETGDFEIYVYENNAIARNVDNGEGVFLQNGLPMPPRGTKILNFSGPGGGNVVSFSVQRDVNRVLAEYDAEMFRAGWQEAPNADKEHLPILEGQFKMYQKDNRYVTISASGAKGRQPMISLVVF